MRSITAFVAMCGLVISIPLAVYFARNASTTEAGWWDELWNYRKRISLGNSGSSQTSKRVSINTDTATMITDGKLQTDCDDIRFTDINGKLLEHRINANNGIQVTQVSQTSSSASSTSLTFTHTVTSGSNQALVVVYHGMMGNENGQNVTDVTINGTSLTTEQIEVDSTSTSRSYVTSIWTMVDPFDGLTEGVSYDIVVTLSASGTSHVAAAYTLTGVDQSTPAGITASNTTDSVATSTITTGTTSYANSLLVGGSLVRADADYPKINAPAVFSYWQQAGSDNTEAGGAGGYVRTTATGVYSATFGSEEGSNTAFNGALVEMKPVTSTTSCNTATTDLEVLVDSIPAGGTEIFMYYGNNMAASNQSQLVDPTKVVTYDTDSSYDSGSSGTNYAFNHTVTSSLSNPVLVAIVHGLNSQTGSTPFRFSSVTYNGDLMQFRSRWHSYTTNRNLTTEVWILPNPDSGSAYSLSATSNVSIDRFAGAAITMYNVGQFADNDWWTGGNGATVADQTLTFTLSGAARTLIGGAVETTADANQLDVITGTSVYTQDTGNTDNSHISAAGGYRAASPVENTLVIGQSTSTTQHINGAGISLIADQTYTEFTPTSGPTLQSEEKSPGPVLYWKLDEASDNLCTGGVNDICDSTSNLNDGTYSATRASGSSCLLGGCYQFNGTTNLITLPTASDAFVDFAGSEAFSGSAWIYVTTMPTGSDKDAVIAKWDENSNHAAYRLYVENDDSDSTGNIAVQIYDESATQAITATGTTDGIVQNTWYHVAFTFNGGTSGAAGDLKLYVNGSYQAQNILNGSFAGLENLASDFTVADYDTNDSTSGNTAFTGTIDEVKMFAYARSTEHMKNDYLIGSSASGSNVVLGGGLTPMPTPIVRWKFDEGSGAVANNSGSTGSVDNGSITSGAWSLSGKYDKALTFTASTSVTDTITDPGNTNTLSLWVYPTTSVDSKTLITAGKLATDASSRPTYGTCTGTALALNEWTHIVAVSGGAGSCALYQNGVATSTNTTGVTFGTSINVGGSSFTGSIDEVKVYDDALSAAQVKVDFNGDAAINLGSGVNERSAITGGDYQSSLVGYWPLDENTGISTSYDKSGNAYDFALTSIAESNWVPAKYGSGISFDGSNDYASSTSENGNLSISTYSVSTWFKRLTDSGGAENLVDNRDSANDGWRMYINSSDQVICRHNDTGTNSSSTISLDTWYHAMCVADGSSLKLYLNGNIEFTNGAVSGTISETTDLRLAASAFDAAEKFTGVLDNVKVFSSALTPAQVAYEYSRGLPIAWLRFDECLGTTLNNATGTTSFNATWSGSGGTNTSTGNCVSGTSNQAWYNGATGKFGASLDFDGGDDIVSIPNSTFMDFNEGLVNGFTITAWISPDSDGEDDAGYILAKGTNNYCKVGSESGGKVTVSCRVNLATDAEFSATTTIPTGQWSHFGLSWTDDGDDEITIWINGIAHTSSGLYAGATAGENSSLYIGNDTGQANTFDGKIDEVRVYNYELSAQQIRSVMTGGNTRFE